MGKDQRWPYVWFLLMRSLQLVFGTITLATAAYVVSVSSYWAAGLAVFIGLVIVVWVIVNFVLFSLELLLPVAVVVVDAFCVVFLLVAMAGTAASDILSFSCRLYTSDSLNSLLLWEGGVQGSSAYWTPCLVAKVAFGSLLLSMCLFIVTLAYSSTVLHKTRKDLRGKKYSQGLPFMTAGHSGDEQQQQQQAAVTQFSQQPQPQAFEPEPQSTFVTGHYPQPSVYTTQLPFHQQPVSPLYPDEEFPTHHGFVVSPPNSPPPAAVHRQYSEAWSHSHGIAELGSLSEHREPQPQHPQQEQQQQQR